MEINLEKQEVSQHVFIDASNEAYAAVAYLKVKYKNGESRRLVAAKTKVVSMEATSTSRIELMAAVLTVKPAIPMKKVLAMPEKKIFYGINSVNVLWLIKNRSCALKMFRIAKIQKESSPTRWKYVKTDNNPADLPSRSLPATPSTQQHQQLMN